MNQKRQKKNKSCFRYNSHNLYNDYEFSHEKHREYKRMKVLISYMSKRITIVLDDDLVKKLRERQSNLIKKSAKSVSFSRVLNESVRKGLK